MAHYAETEEILNVLLIDDEPMLLGLIPLIINHFDPNLRVEALTEPRKAVEKVLKFPYAVVVVDYSMPEVNGLSLVKAIKYPGCSVYPIHGAGNDELRDETFTSRVDDYIKKIDNPRRVRCFNRSNKGRCKAAQGDEGVQAAASPLLASR